MGSAGFQPFGSITGAVGYGSHRPVNGNQRDRGSVATLPAPAPLPQIPIDRPHATITRVGPLLVLIELRPGLDPLKML